MKSNFEKIGEHIRLIDDRNTGLRVKQLLGLTISKQFIPSVANIVGTDLENYKIIRKNQFACSTMQVRRDKKMPVALLKNIDEAIISQAYPVFEVKDTDKLFPEYLMMWLSRPEFDREACFYAIGGVRGSLEWEDFCDMRLPVPDIVKQKEIVKEYNTIINRIELNNRLIQKLEETAQAIYKQWFGDFEFPDEEGKPYKSNGGEMIESDLGEIPNNWSVGYLSSVAFYIKNRIRVESLQPKEYISTENMIQNKGGVIDIEELPQAEYVTEFKIDDVLVSNIRPYLKKIWLATFDGGCSNDVLCFRAKQNISPEYLFYTMESNIFFDYVMSGSNGVKMPRGDKNWIMDYPTIIPKENILEKFQEIQLVLKKITKERKNENILLKELSLFSLLKLATS